jgi:hypothetical protein
MLKNNPKITELMYDNLSKLLSENTGITIQEAASTINEMSFSQYLKLIEAGANITPPSGQQIGPNAGAPSMPGGVQPQQQQQQQQQSQQGAKQSAPVKTPVMWKGQGAPIEQGMTVGLKGVNGMPVPGEITQVDQSANGVKVKNPTTGQEEWHGNDDLEPYIATSTPGMQQQMSEEIKRIRQLAGIAEDASGGCTGAGSVGSGVPVALGGVKRRKQVEEAPKVEYTPKVAKTVAGDTKPLQASGKLSADLAARGMKTAARTNNGFKK